MDSTVIYFVFFVCFESYSNLELGLTFFRGRWKRKNKMESESLAILC